MLLIIEEVDFFSKSKMMMWLAKSGKSLSVTQWYDKQTKTKKQKDTQTNWFLSPMKHDSAARSMCKESDVQKTACQITHGRKCHRKSRIHSPIKGREWVNHIFLVDWSHQNWSGRFFALKKEHTHAPHIWFLLQIVRLLLFCIWKCGIRFSEQSTIATVTNWLHHRESSN